MSIRVYVRVWIAAGLLGTPKFFYTKFHWKNKNKTCSSGASSWEGHAARSYIRKGGRISGAWVGSKNLERILGSEWLAALISLRIRMPALPA